MIKSITMNPNPQRAEPTTTLRDFVDPPTGQEFRAHSTRTPGRSLRLNPISAAPAAVRYLVAPLSSLARSGSGTLPGPRASRLRVSRFFTADCAMAGAGGRTARAPRPRLDHVWPNAAQGSRTLHSLRHRNACRSALARRPARRPLAANCRQPQRANRDGAAIDAARR